MTTTGILGLPALTMLAPWGSCIMRWGKRYENRDWIPPRALKGKRVGIHQGQMALRKSGAPAGNHANRMAYSTMQHLADEEMVLADMAAEQMLHDAGKILGTCILADVLEIDINKNAVSLWARPGEVVMTYAPRPGETGLTCTPLDAWIDSGSRYALHFTDPQIFEEPVPCSGLQKFWTVTQQRLDLAQGTAR